MRSKRHGTGFSLRFPRIHALRPDKSVDEIDTVATVTALYEGLQHGLGIAGDSRRQDVRRRGRMTFPTRRAARMLPRMSDGDGGARAPST